MHITLAITGATGIGFSISIIKQLAINCQVKNITLLISTMGHYCLKNEYNMELKELEYISNKIKIFNEYNLTAPLSSGSFRQNGMIIVPCSTGTLGRIASGTSETLITRVADICLKERQPLILCLRETPLNRIHINNMLHVCDAGAILMPIMPSFYYHPKTIDDLFQAFAIRVLDQLKLNDDNHNNYGRWQLMSTTPTKAIANPI